MNCSKCGYDNDNDAEFCENCGSVLTRVCANCGNPVKSGTSFCKKCGAPVSSRLSSKEEKERLARLQQSAPTYLQEKIRNSSKQGEGERKPTTILFADIVGSTSLAEKLDPEEWKEVVSGAHQRIIKIIHHYEGTIAQLLGDGVLAFFGAPITHEDDPVRAVRASLDIQDEINKYEYELKGYIEKFQLRIGVNTGMVVVGSVGSDLHMEYLAIGDAVNLAARLQSAAQPGTVLISEGTARLVKYTFELKSLGEISVKGKAEPVGAYEVIVSKATPVSGRGFAELYSPLVGRTKELAELNQAIDELCNGHGQIVAILGEAGIGKSRLVEEARISPRLLGDKGQANERCQLHWIEGRALSYGATLSFWTVSQLIKNDLGLSDADPEPKIRLTIRRRLSDLFSDQSERVMPYLFRLLGIKLEGEVADQINSFDSETLKRQTLISIAQYFEKVAASQPVVAVFEDLHWADPSSLEALELLLSVTDRAPLMILLLSRPEREHASWKIKLKAETEYAHRYTEIQLKPLSSSQQNELVDNLLSISDLPEQVRNLIQEHAEGNPFYLEEIVRSLIEQGAIIRAGDQWRVSREISDVNIPDTLQGVLLARLDRLEEDVRHTLQLASVIGRSFLYSILEVISEAELQLDQHLAQLQRVDLVREKARLPELEYMFKHSLTQEAAYNSLLVVRRYEFHRKVGEALERLFPDRLEEFYGLLAHHFESAGENRKAVEYLRRAGDKARGMFELSEAIGFYKRMIPLLAGAENAAQLAQVWLKLGLVYCTNFQFEEAHQANETAFALQKQSGFARQSQPIQLKPAVLRIGSAGGHFSLDPAEVSWESDYKIVSNLYSGLVQVDTELNIVPDVARSWQVLDGGRLYRFHLRDDSYWSDGTPVTAHDFEYALKRNLQPKFARDSATAYFLYDISGARDYCEGQNPDPDSIAVRALEDDLLEINLAEPVAYFLFILSLPQAYPLPRNVIERLGELGWQTGKMVSNGPYHLVENDVRSGSIIERNPNYQGQFNGNAKRVELNFSQNAQSLSEAYRNGSVDITFQDQHEILSTTPTNEIHFYPHPRTEFISFAVGETPFNDLQVRKAFSMALDRVELSNKFSGKIAAGGLIPPGIPGHTPDAGLGFDLEIARELLADAGYPGGKGFPKVSFLTRVRLKEIDEEVASQWKEHLGVEMEIEALTPRDLMVLRADQVVFNLLHMNWTFDYPDPDNILCQPTAFLDVARLWGWNDEGYLALVKKAGRTPNLQQRMDMYRQADRILVQDQVILIPTSYVTHSCAVVKPWVKNLQITPTGRILLKDVLIEAH